MLNVGLDVYSMSAKLTACFFTPPTVSSLIDGSDRRSPCHVPAARDLVRRRVRLRRSSDGRSGVVESDLPRVPDSGRCPGMRPETMDALDDFLDSGRREACRHDLILHHPESAVNG